MASGDPPASCAPSAVEVEAAFVAALDALDQVLRLREQLAVIFREGCFALSRARYNLGALRVTALQYPAAMTATATLSLNPAEHPLIDQPPTLVLERPLPASNPPLKAAEATTAALEGEKRAEGLRRRGAAGSSSPDVPPQPGMVEESVTSKYGRRATDPLHWFGALVPPALREAQADFSKALSTVTNLANAVLHLESAQNAYFLLAGGDGRSPLKASPRANQGSFEVDGVSFESPLKVVTQGNAIVKEGSMQSDVVAGMQESTLLKDLAARYGLTS